MLFKYSGKYVNIYFNMKLTFFALELLFLGCASGVAFLAPSAYPTLRPSPAVAGLVGFCCGPPC